TSRLCAIPAERLNEEAHLRMKLPQFSAFGPRSKSCVLVLIACVAVVAGPLSAVSTSIASEPLAKGIQDNSFFVEEAYNQEPSVVQHILNVPINFTNGSRDSPPKFTPECAALNA